MSVARFEDFCNEFILAIVAQLVEWRSVEQAFRGSNPRSDKQFLKAISFKWGNEPKGEQQGQQHK